MGSSKSPSNMKAVILLIVASAAFAQEGKILEWTITGEAFEVCIRPKETLTFTWEGPFHNVEKVDAEGYENCDGFDNTEGVEGPYVFSNRNEGHTTLSVGLVATVQEVKRLKSLSAETVEKFKRYNISNAP